MNMTFHFVGTEGSPFMGGMEESILRIGKYFVSFGAVVHLYTRLKPLEPAEKLIYSEAQIDFLDMEDEVAEAVKPLPGWNDADKSERARMYSLFLANHVARNVGANPSRRHVLISFSIAKNGYACQHVAARLGLPHIACIRGTDFSRDFLSSTTIAGIEHVIRHANWVVTTNSFQLERIERLFGRVDRCRNILNPVAVPVAQLWRPAARDRVRIFCDSGYSYRKGTHLLVAVVRELMAEGAMISLTIVGRQMSGAEKAYWEKFVEENRSIPHLELRDYVPKQSLTDLILNADIYCSASLGEGCSNASLSAVALGIPIVATNCGALAEVTTGLPNVALVPPLDRGAFKLALQEMTDRLRAGLVQPDYEKLRALHGKFSVEAESASWREVAEDIEASEALRANAPHRSLSGAWGGLTHATGNK